MKQVQLLRNNKTYRQVLIKLAVSKATFDIVIKFILMIKKKETKIRPTLNKKWKVRYKVENGST